MRVGFELRTNTHGNVSLPSCGTVPWICVLEISRDSTKRSDRYVFWVMTCERQYEQIKCNTQPYLNLHRVPAQMGGFQLVDYYLI